MILAIILTYFPEKELLEKNISAIIHSVDKILIWENTPSDLCGNYRFVHHQKVEYHGDGINSISHALNYAWRYAKAHGYDHLLTMDQDSCFEDFPRYLKQTILNEAAPKGIYSPPIEGKTVANDFEEVDMPITSGMLIPVGLIDKIGGWDEDFQIDSVDDEFCLHAHVLGIKTFVVSGVVMQHRLGLPATRKFLGHTITLRNYPPRRLHYIYRNNIILVRKYPQFSYIRRNLFNWLKQIVWMTLFEGNKAKKLAAIIRGCIAGLTFSGAGGDCSGPAA